MKECRKADGNIPEGGGRRCYSAGSYSVTTPQHHQANILFWCVTVKRCNRKKIIIFRQKTRNSFYPSLVYAPRLPPDAVNDDVEFFEALIACLLIETHCENSSCHKKVS